MIWKRACRSSKQSARRQWETGNRGDCPPGDRLGHTLVAGRCCPRQTGTRSRATDERRAVGVEALRAQTAISQLSASIMTLRMFPTISNTRNDNSGQQSDTDLCVSCWLVSIMTRRGAVASAQVIASASCPADPFGRPGVRHEPAQQRDFCHTLPEGRVVPGDGCHILTNAGVKTKHTGFRKYKYLSNVAKDTSS